MNLLLGFLSTASCLLIRINMILFLFGVIGPAAYSFSQDAFFSQTSSSPLFLNPAHTGNISEKWRASGNYKNHWKDFGVQGKVSAISFDLKCFGDSAKKEFFGIGIFFFNDQIGNFAYSTTDAGISLAFHTKNPEKKQKFSAGLQAGIIQKSLDVTDLTWSSQFVGDHYDNTIVSGENFYSGNILRENFSAGAFWQYVPSEKFGLQCGMSIYHINRPDVSFIQNNVDKLDSRFSVHAGADIGILHGHLFLLPRAAYFQQGDAQRWHFDLTAKKKIGSENSIGAGISYRISALAPVVYIELVGFRMGASYDLNMGNFQSAFGNTGGMGISLSYMPFGKTKSSASFQK